MRELAAGSVWRREGADEANEAAHPCLEVVNSRKVLDVVPICDDAAQTAYTSLRL